MDKTGLITYALPKEYGYVMLSTAGTFFLGLWLGFRQAPFRKVAQIKYPQSSAEQSQIDAASDPQRKKAMYLFNCAQRAHANYLENQPTVVLATLISGVEYPVAASSLLLGWMVCRVAYAIGYTRKDKDDGSGRNGGIGGLHFIFQFVLLGLSAWTAARKALA